MVVGLDYFGTISKNPKYFRKLAGAMLSLGYPVYIVTAVKPDRVGLIKKLVKDSKVPHTGLEILTFINFEDIPTLKLQACKQLSIDFMFDDMPEVCDILKAYGILTAQVG